MVTPTVASLHPCVCNCIRTSRPSFSSHAGIQSTCITSNSNAKKPWFGGLMSQLSTAAEEASKAVKKASQELLDTFVDSTFTFTDQTLLPSESNFAPVDEIGEAIEISRIEGEIPEDFPEGVYIRNGSNPLFGALHSTVSVFGRSSETWVEGEGMLHALYFTKNNAATASTVWSVSYRNRYVQSETLRLERAYRKPRFLPAIEGDTTAILAAYILNFMRFGKVNKDISNTNVFGHAGRVYAVAESHLPQEIRIDNLATCSTWDVGGHWDRPFTAHPKVAPGSGELVIFGSDATRPFLVIGVVSADGTKLKHKADLKLDRCTLCHDIGITPNYNIIIDVPLTININRLIQGGQLIEFEKDSYARIGVMPRYGDAESVMWFDVEPFCMFHLINCFEDGDEVVVRGFRSPESIIPGPRLELNKYNRLSEGSDITRNEEPVNQGINKEFFSRSYQWRLNLKTKAVSGEYLAGTEFSMEFPMINNYYTGLHHSYAYAQVVDSLTSSSCSSIKVLPKYGGFAKLCLEEKESIISEVIINEIDATILLSPRSHESQILNQSEGTNLIKTQHHSLGKNEFCSGAAFVPKVGGTDEDDGWIISFVHNEKTNTSQVHIIDTRRFEGGPVAKITLPQRVPYGFHGTFIQKEPNRGDVTPSPKLRNNCTAS